MSILQSINFKIPNQNKKVIILIQDKNVASYAFSLAKLIRDSGIICEIYTGDKSKLKDQFKYADDLWYDYTVVIGKNEMENKTLNFKNQITKEKGTISIEGFISMIIS